MIRRAAPALMSTLVLTAQVNAAEFPSGRWAFGDTCGVAMDGDSLGSGMVLTPKGIVTDISNCQFVQIWPGDRDRWAVMELCSGNDSTWSRISALERTGEDELIHTSEIEGELVFRLCPGSEVDYPAGPPPDPEPPASGGPEQASSAASGSRADPEPEAEPAPQSGPETPSDEAEAGEEQDGTPSR